MKVKILVFVFLSLISQYGIAQNTRITSFDHLMESLNSGAPIRVIIHYALCKLQEDQNTQSPVPDAITGMDIDTYEYFAPGAAHNKIAFVVFSNAKLIKNPVGKGFVYNYGKVRINADNTVQVTANYIHPKRFKTKMEEIFIGKLNDGKNGEGINIFAGN